MELREIEAAMEAILFAAGDPVGVERLCMSLEIDKATAEAVAQRLADRYSFERRGMRLLKMDNTYQLCSAPEYADVVRKTFESRRPAKLSQPALEVLAIVAYFQPVTRAYIEDVRGVDSSYSVNMLTERGLIEPCGKLEVPGRPTLFRTTENFLRVMEIEQLEDLPALPEIAPEEGVDALRAAIEQRAENGVQLELGAEKDEQHTLEQIIKE